MATAIDHPAAAGIDVLRRLLDTLRRQARFWIWIESLALFGLAAGGAFWASLLFDWLVEPPAWVRGGMMAAAAIGLAVLMYRGLVARLATPLGDASLATLVERRHAGFRDSLSTAIELSAAPRGDVDPGLLGRTIEEAVAVVGDVRPATLFRRRRLVGLFFAALAAVASIAALAVARPAVAGLWVRRMVLLGEEQWPRRTSLSIEGFADGTRKVARGSDVDVIVKADAGKEIPELVDLRSRGSGAWRTDRMGVRGGVVDGAQAFGHVLRGVSEDLLLEIRGGDARLRNLRLVVVEAPGLAGIEIRATPPAYLGAGTRQVPASRIVQIPRGSAVEISCTSTKPLSAATVSSVVEGREEVLAEFGAESTGEQPPSAGAPREIAARIGSLEGDRTVVVRLTDTDGLVNREPISFVLSAVADEPPQVAVRMRGISTAVTPRATIPLEGTISDDHGIARAAVRVQVVDGPETTLPIARGEPGAASVELPRANPLRVPVEPLGLAAGRKLSLVVTAEDGCTLDGRPNTGASDAWTLDVVTPESLLAMLEAREIILRRRFESCIADLSQVRDRLAAAGAASPEAEDAADERKASSGDGSEAARLAEAASRAAGETAEIAEAFRMIRFELENNLLLTPELEGRLVGQIADPLAAVAAKPLPALVAACRGGTGRADLVRRADEVLARMRAILDKMMELESFNEVVELLRGMIRTQEEIRAETLKRHKERAREALERP